MKKNSFKERIGYKLDLIMSRGTTSLIFLLAIITLVLVILAGIAVMVIERAWAGGSLPFAIWKSFTLSLDAGNLAGVEGSIGLIFVATLSTLGGIFITSTLISIMSTGLSTRLENFQRGNAKIIERNHTVILGYSESAFAIIKELQMANANQQSGCIVIMGDEDKQIMEEQVHRNILPLRSSRIICRNGDTTSAVDLARCSVETSKSVIVNLSHDYQVIRTVLAVSTYLNDETIRNEYPDSQTLHISASINEAKNLEVAKIAGQGYAEILHFKLIISRLMAHVCYQPGLSVVYTELFNFSGNEIYIESFPQLEGMTFHDVQLSFSTSLIIGISRDGSSLINPDPDMILNKEDQLILIAADDHVSEPTEKVPVYDPTGQEHPVTRYRMSAPENLLILGNSSLLTDILQEMDAFLPAGSKITIAGKCSNGIDHEELLNIKYNHLIIECIALDITDRGTLKALLSEGIKHILILSETELPCEQADAKTLTVLLQIRDLEKTLNTQFTITTEMIDMRNQELAQVANVNDFVISNHISGLIMTQVAENRHLASIISDLLNSDGSEIYLKPAKHYVSLGIPIDLYTVTHLVSIRKEVFLGYKKVDPSNKKSAEIILNPNKDTTLTFSEDDWLVVLAED